jgi:hypothetical protein
MDILSVLKREESRLTSKLKGIRSAITALDGDGGRPERRTNYGRFGGDKRVFSDATRTKMSKAAKERWRKVRAAKVQKAA